MMPPYMRFLSRFSIIKIVAPDTLRPCPGIASGIILYIAWIRIQVTEESLLNNMIIRPGMRILFQGDSVTDAGRDRARSDHLGCGYPQFIAGWFTIVHPTAKVTFVNRGVSGDRLSDLLARWTADAVELRPDIVSILIGINDVWNRYRGRAATPHDGFERDLHTLLKRTRDETGAQIVLLDPFVLPVPDDRKVWREDLEPKLEILRALSDRFGAVRIPLDQVFARAAASGDPAVWAADGVHPTPAGHAQIARAWLDRVTFES